MLKTMAMSIDQINAVGASQRSGKMKEKVAELVEAIKASKEKSFGVSCDALFGKASHHLGFIYQVRKEPSVMEIATIGYDKTTVVGKEFKTLTVVKK